MDARDEPPITSGRDPDDVRRKVIARSIIPEPWSGCGGGWVVGGGGHKVNTNTSRVALITDGAAYALPPPANAVKSSAIGAPRHRPTRGAGGGLT